MLHEHSAREQDPWFLWSVHRAMRRDPAEITGRFAQSALIASKTLPAGRSKRAYAFYDLAGYRGP